MIEPLGKRLLVLPDEAQTFWSKEANILKPQNQRERSVTGTVLAAGAEREYVEVGDKVVYGKFSGSETHVDGFEFLILMEDEILGVQTETTLAQALEGVGLTIEQLKPPETNVFSEIREREASNIELTD